MRRSSMFAGRSDGVSAAQDAGGLGEEAGAVRHDGDAQRADHRVEAVVGEGEVGGVGLHEGPAAAALGLAEFGFGAVQPNDGAAGLLQALDHGTGAAGQVEHGGGRR